MFNIGITELIFLATLALLLIGPKQLPEVARTIGRFVNEFKRSAESFKTEFNTSINEEKQQPALDIKTENKDDQANV